MHLLLISGDDEDDNDDETDADDGCDDDDDADDNDESDQGSSCEGTVTGPAWLCTPATHRGFSLSFFRCSKFFCSDISIIPDVSHISRSYQIKLH